MRGAASRWGELTLLSGQGRSGTTWVGELLAGHPDLRYLFEPCSIKYHPPLPTSELVRRVISPHLDPAAAATDAWVLHPDDPRLATFRHVFADHLDRLFQAHFGEDRINHLVVKPPAGVNVAWLCDAWGARRVVWMQRHVGGVVASYLKRDLLRRWSDPEFAWVARTVTRDDPELASAFSLPRTALERLVVLLVVKERIAATQLGGRPTHVVNYEALCADPHGGLAAILEFLGVRSDSPTVQRCLAAVHGARPRAAHLGVDRFSNSLAWGWCQELSPSALRQIARVMDALHVPCPLPGRGLPAQTPRQRLVAMARDALRRLRLARRRGKWVWSKKQR